MWFIANGYVALGIGLAFGMDIEFIVLIFLLYRSSYSYGGAYSDIKF